MVSRRLQRAVSRVVGRLTHRLSTLPVLVVMPIAACNCRCLMCDIWKGNDRRVRMDRARLSALCGEISLLGVRELVVSGGEALLAPDLFAFLSEVKALSSPPRVTLLSSGLTVEQQAGEIAARCDELIVSLDGPPEVHDRIRSVPRAFARLAGGVAALRDVRADFPIAGRSVVQRENYDCMSATIGAAQALGLDRISFLAADVSSLAFNRPHGWEAERLAEVALSAAQATDLRERIEELIARHHREIETRFVAESPAKLRRIAAHFAALAAGRLPESPPCNAPWVSAVVEADGAVRPCFFHASYGKTGAGAGGDLQGVLNSGAAVTFRKSLSVRENPVCRSCVCPLRLPWSAEAGARPPRPRRR
ncbi:MAG: radical SAM protein [Candidatus Schekmanbacteria bacterium]|nr:radical SAM protein [Candidatus Schekmanbacteria bacterium]